MREFFRELLSANLFVTGIILTAGGVCDLLRNDLAVAHRQHRQAAGPAADRGGNLRLADDHLDAVRRLRPTRSPAGRHRGPQCLRDQDHPASPIWWSPLPSSSASSSP